ncbi:hypothetical protein PCANC_26594 [Puccinia coronata f. sp. avenae]|uniref:RNase H type-1 domain-containing protein n=1 Tax=Puccinia coronata f. sp. avenae TaxID=200324 RepID=A0A2N5RWU0_9BASI|nr:hypothetical protein PCANC_26594 [Puccinia coronata f. sp. avenae]
MFRTTPIDVLSRESPLINFFDALKKKNSLFLIKKFTAPDSYPIKRLIQFELANPTSQHSSPIHKLLDRQSIPDYDLSKIEKIQHHMINPWDDFSIKTNNIGIKKDDAKLKVVDQVSELTTNQEHIIFTDGSSIPGNGTASAAILNHNHTFACRINSKDKASTFEAEVLAIKFALARRYRRYAALRHATVLLAAKDAIFAARRAVAQRKRHYFVPCARSR